MASCLKNNNKKTEVQLSPVFWGKDFHKCQPPRRKHTDRQMPAHPTLTRLTDAHRCWDTQRSRQRLTVIDRWPHLVRVWLAVGSLVWLDMMIHGGGLWDTFLLGGLGNTTVDPGT